MPETKKKSAKKAKTKKIVCKNCGTVVNPAENPPSKTWNLISPMPDKDGNVTLTIMGSFTCSNPDCGKNIKAAVQKIKGDDVALGAKFKKNELLLGALRGSIEKTPLDSIASVVGLQVEKVEKAILMLIKSGKVTGIVKDGLYYPENA